MYYQFFLSFLRDVLKGIEMYFLILFVLKGNCISIIACVLHRNYQFLYFNFFQSNLYLRKYLEVSKIIDNLVSLVHCIIILPYACFVLHPFLYNC